MAYSDKHFLAIIWGLFFIILSLPFLVNDSTAITVNLTKHSETVPAMEKKLNWLHNAIIRS